MQSQGQYTSESASASTYFVATGCPPETSERHDFLSYSFATVSETPGRALVDTAAQHGLIGRETREQLEQHLLANFGMKVRRSGEDGGTVRGVCGAEERTPIAYVPIGIGGCSGLLRVQIVPGPVPCLIPAYLLTDTGSIIDMVGLTLFHTKLGVTQQMYRRSTGHVEICITEYGRGFSMPDAASFGRSQVWSDQPLPTPIQIANAFDMRAPLEAVLLALAIGGVDSSSQCLDHCGAAAPASRRPSPGRQTRAFGTASLGMQQKEAELMEASRRTSPSTTPNLGANIADETGQLRPLTQHIGRSQYLAPVLRKPPTCTHPTTNHGCNQDWSWTKCEACGAIEQIPKLTPNRMTEWNTVLVYQKPTCVTPVAKKGAKLAKKTGTTTGTSSTMPPASPPPTATTPAAATTRTPATSPCSKTEHCADFWRPAASGDVFGTIPDKDNNGKYGKSERPTIRGANAPDSTG